MYKILIIDDNHSFIDSLKLSLREFKLHVESAYKYENAKKLLSKSGPYFNEQTLAQMIEYKSTMDEYTKELKESAKNKAQEDQNKTASEPNPIKIKTPPFQDKGYSLIIIEYDTEASTKGTQFINDMIQHQKGWNTEDFILLTSNESKVEQALGKMNVPIFEKPIKQNALKNLIQKKINKWEQTRQTILDISEMYNIPLEPQKPVRKSRAKSDEPTPKKASAKKK